MAKQSDSQNPWIGRELFDARGLKIGTVGGLGLPRRKFGTVWLLVKTAGDASTRAPHRDPLVGGSSGAAVP